VARTCIVILAAAIGSLCADERHIGTASSDGSFWADSAGVATHATVFDGSTIEAGETPVKLQIPPNVRILLDVGSRAQFWGDRLVLESGRAQLDSGKDYRIEALTMRITPAAPGARALVAIGASGAVEAAALGAAIRVANADGVVVADVAAGRSVELRLSEARDAAVLTGCVTHAGGLYLLRDEVSRIAVELRGAEVANQVGRRVEVTGSVVPPVRTAGAGQIIRAKEVKRLADGCKVAEVPATSGSRARLAPQVGSIASASAGAHTAVISGVAVGTGAGAGGGIVAARHRHKPPISHGR
jgi:hypothetical protein